MCVCGGGGGGGGWSRRDVNSSIMYIPTTAGSSYSEVVVVCVCVSMCVCDEERGWSRILRSVYTYHCWFLILLGMVWCVCEEGRGWSRIDTNAVYDHIYLPMVPATPRRGVVCVCVREGGGGGEIGEM